MARRSLFDRPAAYPRVSRTGRSSGAGGGTRGSAVEGCLAGDGGLGGGPAPCGARQRKAWFLNDLEKYVCIREETGHRSGLLIFEYLLFDFLTVRANISPGIGKVLGAQRRISLQQFRLTRSRSSRMIQYPDRNAWADNARIA